MDKRLTFEPELFGIVLKKQGLDLFDSLCDFIEFEIDKSISKKPVGNTIEVKKKIEKLFKCNVRIEDNSIWLIDSKIATFIAEDITKISKLLGKGLKFGQLYRTAVGVTIVLWDK